MLNYFKAFLVFLLWACFALTSHYFIATNYFNKKAPIPIKKVTSIYSIISSKNDTLFKYKIPFKIQKNNPKILNLNHFNPLFDTLSSYLKNNYDKKIIITGFYSQNEIDSNNTKNIGLLRAQEIKTYFQNNEIKNYQLKILNKANYSLFKKSANPSGINLKIDTISAKNKDSIENSICNKRIYIDFNNHKIVVNKAIKNYIILLRKYLKKHPNKTIYITGHTDSKGYYQNNLIIGLNRANLIKNFFNINGIENSKMIALSKGESEPIAAKNTIEGKAKNKRIEIKIN